MTSKSIRFLVCSVLALGLTAPAWATVNDSEKPGSVLVFPKFIRGTFNDTGATGELAHARTEIEISVRCPDGATCTKDPFSGAGQVVRMRAHWVCPGCTENSFDLETTVNGSLYFNTEGTTDVLGVITANAFPSNATTTIPIPRCLRGYLIVWVVDGNGDAIKWDGLIGDAILRDPPPVALPTWPRTARGYNAIPIQASQNFGTGNLTDVDLDGSLDFDGSEYQMVTGRIFGTVRYEDVLALGGTVQTDLTLLTLDVRSNETNPITTVKLNFYSDDEDLVDTAARFTCWTEQRLTVIDASLRDDRMGRKGLVESTSAEQQPDFFTTVPVTVLGLFESIEFDTAGFPARDYAYSLNNDGNPVPTTFKP